MSKLNLTKKEHEGLTSVAIILMRSGSKSVITYCGLKLNCIWVAIDFNSSNIKRYEPFHRLGNKPNTQGNGK